MAIPSFTMRSLFEAGVHFGHHPRRRNPKMDPFLFGVRNSISIIDLEKTVPMLQRALQALRDVAASGGRILFVGTKSQASEKVSASAKKSGQCYVNHRWLGGMMTNWKTVSQSIRTLKTLEDNLQNPEIMQALTKKELLSLTRERDKLERALGGIKDMGGVPDILFVIDTNKENIAILEANKLKIPVVAILDSNSNPDGIAFPVPGNDDALRAIDVYCDLVTGAILDGLQAQMVSAGVDVGASVDVASVDTAIISAEEMGITDSAEGSAQRLFSRPPPK